MILNTIRASLYNSILCKHLTYWHVRPQYDLCYIICSMSKINSHCGVCEMPIMMPDTEKKMKSKINIGKYHYIRTQMPKVNTGTSSVPTHHCHSYCLRRMKSHREPCGDQCGTWWEFLIFRCSVSSGASRRLSHGKTHFESWLPVLLLSCKHTENLQILNTLEKKLVQDYLLFK